MQVSRSNIVRRIIISALDELVAKRRLDDAEGDLNRLLHLRRSAEIRIDLDDIETDEQACLCHCLAHVGCLTERQSAPTMRQDHNSSIEANRQEKRST